MSTATEADVLVIGAGPSGLFAAAELARHGVRARLVERDPVPHHQARATALQPGTLELLHQAGIIDRVLAESMHVEIARVFNADLRQVGQMSFAGVGTRWEYQCSLPQWQTERILAGHLAELGGTVERGVCVTSMREEDDRVLVELERADGTRETVAARWVAGAGGAHSVARASMAEELEGSTYPVTALAADVRVSAGLPRDGSAFFATPGGYVLLAPLPGDRWITFVGDLDAGEAERLTAGPSRSAVAAIMGRRVTADRVHVDEVSWATAFRMHQRLAPRLGDGRRFLLGDAGHLTSPLGGEGLNSGLHDAHNLAWKLALEQQGNARPALLASYAAERLAADRHTLALSDRLHGLALGAVESARTGVYPPDPAPAEAAALVRSRSMLDVAYPGSPLNSQYTATHPAPDPAPDPTPQPGDRYPDRCSLAGTRHHLLIFGDADAEQLGRLKDRWHGLVDINDGGGDRRAAGLAADQDGVVLVRPDGYLGFRCAPASRAGLAALDAHLSSYLVPA